MRTARRRNELRAEDARIQAERQTLGRARTRAESWALIVAALVGAASLSVTAWGTYWTAQVAEDQLAQSKKQNEDNARVQASKVTIWLERPKGESRDELVIVNRSLDPVNQLVVDISIDGGSPDLLFPAHTFSVLPPCSEIRIAATDLGHSPGEPSAGSDEFVRVQPSSTKNDHPTGKRTASKPSDDVHIAVAEFQFIDSKGMRWHRDSHGVLRAGPGSRFLLGNPPLENTPVRPLKECGSDQ